MISIDAMKKKSIWTIIKIFTKLDLRNYNFKCTTIFLKIKLQRSIIYTSEAYYNLKGTEIKQ